jgi:hypothetical protein
MTRSLATLAALGFVLSGQLAEAGTQLYACDRQGERVVCTEVPEVPEVPAVPVAAPAPAEEPAVEPELLPPTHTFFLPTGQLTPKGTIELQVHELGLYNTISVGVTDRLEITFGAPVIPVVATAGARFSLTGPRSPLKLVVGAGATAPVLGGDGALLNASGTIAYQTARTNLHATVAAFVLTDDGGGAGVLSAGIAVRSSRGLMLTADVVRLSTHDLFQPMYDIGCVESCADGGDFTAHSFGVVGVKVLGDRVDLDLGLMIPLWDTGDGGERVIPLLSFGYHH